MSSEPGPNAPSAGEDPASPLAGQGRAEERERRVKPRAKAANPTPPVNAIQATRQRRRTSAERPSAPPAAEGGASAPTSSNPGKETPIPIAALPPVGNTRRGDSDPWTVPASIRDRFIQDGHRFYFPDGAPAFKDLGRRLTTPSENTQVVHSLIQIAHSRGWSEVTVSGTERFRQEAWRQARMAGLAVRGYRPTDPEQAQLIRDIARKLSAPLDRRPDAISAEAQPAEARAPAAAAPQTNPPKERIAGRLLDHGQAPYRHDPQEDVSYFVRVETREGKREIWGKDLERAMKQSLTQPKVGEEVILQKTGRELVTIKRAERGADGELKAKDVQTHRNRWVIEKSGFLDERARAAAVVRNDRIDAVSAVRSHPELAGTYLNLKAGELAAQRLRDPEDRQRFVALLRNALADQIERGEALQPVRLRERAARTSERAAREAARAAAR